MASASASTAIPAIAALRSSSHRDILSPVSAALPRSGFSHNLSFSPLSVTSPVNGRSARIVSMATGDTSEASKTVQDALKYVQDAWEKTDDKLAVGGLGFTALIVLWASAGLIGAIDKLPLIPNFFEFVGILFSGWFIYRYLLFKPDREELVKKLESALAKITGSEA
ncbi:hypothetical protein GOP47_0027685 [Adiantum capillus-veneris]|nr:hypothetical protein GOP47_0027685 [Adiantum capillus-veneris]